MEDVKFVLKSLAITIVVVFMLQIRVGTHTIEASTHDWLQNSAITELMRGVADGGIKVSIDFYNWVRAKTGVGESKKSSFWSFGSSDSKVTHSRSVRRSSARVEPPSVSEDATEPVKKESNSSGSFHWGGSSSHSKSLPENVGSGESASDEISD